MRWGNIGEGGGGSKVRGREGTKELTLSRCA